MYMLLDYIPIMLHLLRKVRKRDKVVKKVHTLSSPARHGSSLSLGGAFAVI